MSRFVFSITATKISALKNVRKRLDNCYKYAVIDVIGRLRKSGGQKK